MERRNFLKSSVFAGTAGLALDACTPGSSQLIPILVPEEPFVPGEETWLRSTCFECTAHCGIEVRKIDGRLVKVEGNAEQPMSRGGLCARGQASPQAMYHPDRIRTPLEKQSDGSWHELGWDQALDRIAETLGDDADVAFLTGDLTGHRRAIVHRFLASFGSSRHLVHEPFSMAALAETGGFADPDLDNAGYVVSFGAELLESHTSPVRFGRALAELRQGRPGRRGKLVMVGPRLSLTAANADEWVPVRAGQDVDLALELARVLVRDGRGENITSEGLDRFRAFLDEVTPSETAERLAREMVSYGPAVCIAGGAALRSPWGRTLAVVVSHLNALLGTRTSPVPAPPFAEWPALEGADPTPSVLTEALASDPPRVLFTSGTNPAHTLSPGFGFEKWLSSISLHVSFASFLDETAVRADLVLPESMSFERFEDAVPEGAPVSMATLAQPLLVRPLYDTRSMPDSLIEIAKRSGHGESFPFRSYEDALRQAWSGLDTSWEAALARGGWWDEPASRGSERYRFDTDALESPTPTAAGLELHIYASTPFGDGRSAHLPFLQELSDPITGVRWGSVVEISSERAEELSVQSGELVEVSSETGSVVLRAHVTPGIHPDVVAIAAGQGHTAYGRYAQGRGVNAYALLSGVADEQGPLVAGTPVMVKKVVGS